MSPPGSPVLVLACLITPALAQIGTVEPPADATAVIRGRCTAAENGATLPGCVVTVTVEGTPDGTRLPRALRCPAPVTTGEDGLFELRILARRGCAVQLRIEHPQRCPRTGRRSFLRPGITYRVDAPMRRGVMPRGVLRDGRGAPIQTRLTFARKWFPPRPLLPSPRAPTPGPTTPDAPRGPATIDKSVAPGVPFPTREPVQFTAETGPSGRFVASTRIPKGIYVIRPGKRGYRTVSPTEFAVSGAGDATPELAVQITEIPHLSGIVVDGGGAPVAGIRLRVKNNRYGPAIGGISGTDGRFKIHRTGPCPELVPIVIEPDAPCVPRGPTAPVAWGKTGIRIEVRRLPQVNLRVLAAETGQPIERFAIRCYPANPRSAVHLTRLRETGPHPQGVVRIPDVRLGTQVVVAVPDDPTRLPTAITVHGSFTMKPLTIRVPRLTPMQVTLVDGRGQPVSGLRVRVVRTGTHRSRSQPVLVDLRAARVRARSDGGATFDTILYQTRTDAVGQCVVYGIRDRPDIVLDLVQGALPRGRYAVRFGADRLSRRITLGSNR